MAFNANKFKSFSGLLLLIGLFSAIFLGLVINYANSHVENSYANWQNKISMLSDIKAENIKKWFEEKDAEIDTIRNNITVQLYLTKYVANNKVNSDDKIVQQEFLSSYIISEARKAGFINSQPQTEKINANIKTYSDAALVVFDKDWDIIVSKDYETNLQKLFSDNLSDIKFLNSTRKIISDKKNVDYYINIQPINYIQSAKKAGYIMGIKKIGNLLDKTLSFPPENYETAVSSLASDSFEEIKIVASSKPSEAGRVINFASKVQVAEISAVNNPNEIQTQTDGNNHVIIIAKQIDGFPWFMIYKIDEAEALGDAFSVRRSLIINSILILTAVILVIILAWRHSTSIKYKKLSEDFEKSNKLLNLVTENQIQKMFIMDSKNILRFANERFAKGLEMAARKLRGKELKNILGPAKAREYTDVTSKLDANQPPFIITKKLEGEGGKQKYVDRKFIPIENVPVNDNFDTSAGTLIIENDITEVIEERIKTEKNLNNIITLLINIVEERSMYYHNHSETVLELSRKIAEDLELDDRQIRALEIAARLSNLYLVLLPITILNKKSKLTDEEQAQIDACPVKTAEMIKNIEFNAPVLQTIQHQQERVDGKGPQKLKESEIIITAKILKAANDYVAMISPRAYRKSLSKEIAIEELLKFRGSKYGSDVVYSLINQVSKN